MNILIINGSLGGASGNTSVIIEAASKFITAHAAHFEIIHLENAKKEDMKSKLSWAHGFIFTSGTYWDSWGSPMQKFLEDSTQFENSDLFFGKPAGVVITMHSVGGKGVLSRLQGVLNTMGVLIPPMSGMVYSLTGHIALKNEEHDFGEDFWSLDDLEIIVHNLMTAVNKKTNYKAWPVDKKDPKRRWL
ncbi:MAG: NAD(P)H-dependent oxidoreductase [Bacteriovorax sp.]|jgi:multimeric flavodoxin WrbA